jgi:hypothetical protein
LALAEQVLVVQRVEHPVIIQYFQLSLPPVAEVVERREQIHLVLVVVLVVAEPICRVRVEEEIHHLQHQVREELAVVIMEITLAHLVVVVAQAQRVVQTLEQMLVMVEQELHLL